MVWELMRRSQPSAQPIVKHIHLEDQSVTAGNTATHTITIEKQGKMLAFLAVVNKKSNSTGNTTTCRLARNGQTLSHSITVNTDFPTGIMFYENLNYLSGANVDREDKFELSIVATGANLVAYNVTLFVIYQEI